MEPFERSSFEALQGGLIAGTESGCKLGSSGARHVPPLFCSLGFLQVLGIVLHSLFSRMDLRMHKCKVQPVTIPS